MSTIQLENFYQKENSLIYELSFDFEYEDTLEIIFSVSGMIVDNDMFTVKVGKSIRSFELTIQEEWISKKISISYNLRNGLILLGSRNIDNCFYSSDVYYKVELEKEKNIKIRFRNSVENFIYYGDII